jgi:hypothetical protein
LGKLLGSNITLAPFGGMVGVVLYIFFRILLRRFSHKKISTLRCIIKKTKKVERNFALIYVLFFTAFLPIITFIIMILTLPHHHHYHHIQ